MLIVKQAFNDCHFSTQGLFKAKGKKGKGSNHGRVKELMDKTKPRRFNWIRQDPQPMISEVVEKFPHLKSSKWVSQ